MNRSRLSRRELLQSAACGFGGLALGGMLAQAAGAAGPLAIRRPHFPARAKRMIFVFLAGGPSQGDLFAPKEEITRNHGKAITSPVGDDGQIRVGVAKFLPMAPVAPVKPRGKVNCMPAPSYIRNGFARQSEDSRVDEGCLVMLAGPIQ